MLSLARERLEAAAAVSVAICVQLIIPQRLVIGPVLLIPAIEAVLLATLLIGRIRFPDPHHNGMRRISVALVLVLVIATLAATLRLVALTVAGGAGVTAQDLIRAGTGIWTTNVIAFAILFWELDLGGPAQRAVPRGRGGSRKGDDPGHGTDPIPDFLFPQYDSARTPTGWQPTFADYLYTSFTNATAFSPTDTMPTGHRAKAMMALQSAVALVTMAFLLARAVNVLGS